MEDFDKIRGLLAERSRQVLPGPEYLDRFLNEFHERQRREAMSVPVWRLIWERTGTWLARWRSWRCLGLLGLFIAGSGVVAAVRWPQQEGSGRNEAGAVAFEDISQGFGGFAEAVMEPSAADLMEPSLVQIGWGGNRTDQWTPGFQVADGMFVSACFEARLLDPVKVRMPDKSGNARIVMKDPGSGLVVIHAREWAVSGRPQPGEGR